MPAGLAVSKPDRRRVREMGSGSGAGGGVGVGVGVSGLLCDLSAPRCGWVWPACFCATFGVAGFAGMACDHRNAGPHRGVIFVGDDEVG
jgi:hypothetical protein